MFPYPFEQVALVDIRGRVNKEREEGSDFFSTTYEGLKYDYLDAHIPGAVFVDWTKARRALPPNTGYRVMHSQYILSTVTILRR